MKKLFFLTAVFASALILAGCGSSSPQPVSASINMSEFSFDPDGLTVPAGSEVTLTISNEGALEHNFILMKAGAEVAGAWSDADASGIFVNQSDIASKDSATLVFTAPTAPGEYQILCSVPAHKESGMEATLTVE